MADVDKTRLRLAAEFGLQNICELLNTPGVDRVEAELAMGADVVAVVVFEEWLASRLISGDSTDEIVALLIAKGVEPELARAVVKEAYDRIYQPSRASMFLINEE